MPHQTPLRPWRTVARHTLTLRQPVPLGWVPTSYSNDAYARCNAALTKHRGLADMLVEKLLDVETVNAKELLAMLQEYDPALSKALDKQPPIDSTTLLTSATGAMT